MLIGKALRAWAGSVVTCAVLLLAVWGMAMQQLRGTQNISSMPTERLEQAAAAFFMASGAAFGIAATIVYIPTFILLDALLRRRLNRTRAMLIGGILALVPRVLIAWRIDEAESATAWLLYWARHWPQFPLAVLPFAIAGAVFGWLWSEKGKYPNDVVARRLRRAV